MKQKDNLLAWRALAVTVETGNITQTALLLDLDSAKVSRLIAGLEKEIGFELLVKNRRPFIPTDRCRQILPMVLPLLDGFSRLDEFCAGTAQKILIRFSAPVEMTQQFYSQELLQYSHLNPRIQFSMLPEMTVRELLAGDTDVAVVNQSPADQSEIVARHVVSNSTPVFASPQYLE
ncbi:LysR family transcriptional regulator, partial [uncultured Parasutterella sp.]